MTSSLLFSTTDIKYYKAFGIRNNTNNIIKAGTCKNEFSKFLLYVTKRLIYYMIHVLLFYIKTCAHTADM